ISCHTSTQLSLSTPRPPPQSTLFSLHDALPILPIALKTGTAGERKQGEGLQALILAFAPVQSPKIAFGIIAVDAGPAEYAGAKRSEEHTSELQSRGHLVCRLLLEKKKKKRVEAD